MSNPKHSNPIQPHRDNRGRQFWAHAPYNFIPLPEKVVTVNLKDIPTHASYTSSNGERTFTGYLDCELTTETPTYTRCAVNLEFFKNWADKMDKMKQDPKAREEYAQFNLDDLERPVIPGSSLRGMTRALVEIAGYGKMQWVTGEQLVFRSVGDTTSLGDYYRDRLFQNDGVKKVTPKKGGKPKDTKHYTPLVQGGYLEKKAGNRWFIRPAQVIGGATFARIHRDKIPANLSRWGDCKNAYQIWVQLGQYDYQDVKGGFLRLKYIPVLEADNSQKEGFQKVVLACSGSMDKKQREAVIFPPDTNAPLIEIDNDLIYAYQEQISKEQQNLLGKNGALNPNQPVFYLIEDDKLIFFGHVMMFRLPYNRSPLDFVPPDLRCETEIDLAEAIFGYIATKTDNQGRAGRVYFTDACFESASSGLWLEKTPLITPKILSGPKPTTFQHYLTQQQPDEVPSEKFNKDGSPKMELRLDHYASPPPHKTVIRGHKLYWHKNSVSPKEFEESEHVNWANDTQHTQIKPVNRGVIFRFKVYFENLLEHELGALLWVLDLPPDCRHKIGMGKPLGLGSVQITPQLFLSNRQARYTRLFDGEGWVKGENQKEDLDKYKKAFEKFVLAGIDNNAAALAEIERIKMLLKMLEYPGPNVEWEGKKLTDYMELGEFKERPVLPDPFNLELRSSQIGITRPANPPSQQSRSQQPGSRSQSTRLGQPQSDATQPAKTGPKPEPEFSRPTSEAEMREGIYLEGRVIRVESGRIVVDIGNNIEATLPKDKVIPSISDEDELKRRFFVGKKIEVWVTGRNKKGRIQLTMQKPSN